MLRIPHSHEAISTLCRRWGVQELAVFGSVLRDDFGPESDVDVMVTFEPGTAWSLFDLATMQDELEAIFGRKVDLVERTAVEVNHNWIRREAILHSARPIFQAA